MSEPSEALIALAERILAPGDADNVTLAQLRAEYVASMSDQELSELLNEATRQSTGRGVSAAILRAAQDEQIRRMRDGSDQ